MTVAMDRRLHLYADGKDQGVITPDLQLTFIHYNE